MRSKLVRNARTTILSARTTRFSTNDATSDSSLDELLPCEATPTAALATPQAMMIPTMIRRLLPR